MTSLIGQSLGRYHILEQLGEGGMATVYKAYDTHLECDVAVKVIRLDVLNETAASKTILRFRREAKVLAQLTHPNIVKVTDFGEHEGRPYIVMVYLSGGTLKDKMNGQPLPAQEAARLLAPIARALEYAHKEGLIHRDVKPSNILITQSGEVMLSDFGIAKLFDSEETVDLTGTGVGIGTPEYMAPEQITSKSIDARADIYALGIVYYEMVTGRKPFEADTPLAVLFKHSSEPLPRPSKVLPGIPVEVENVLLKALAKNPGDRYQEMGAFAKALEELAGKGSAARAIPQKAAERPGAPLHAAPAFQQGPGQPLQTTTLASSQPPAKKSSKKWLWWLLGIGGGLLILCGIVALIGFLVLGWSFSGSSGSPTLAPATSVPPTQIPTTQIPTTQIPTTQIQPTQIQPTLGFVGEFNFGASPTYGEISLASGFVPDPFTVEIISGGTVSIASQLTGEGCAGYAASAPDFRLFWSGTSNAINFFFVANGSEDTTLVINDGAGNWYCNDNSDSSLNPQIAIGNPPQGQYDIWIGSYAASTFARGTLYISELNYSPSNLP